MSRNGLLSIGAFSKLTDVSIKSLRYYDQLGILEPAYVDPNTGYRYYAVSQANVADTIQLCVELGIPLRSFAAYTHRTEAGGQEIDVASLVEEGTARAQRKIEELRRGMYQLECMQEEIERVDQMEEAGGTIEIELAAHPCVVVPYEGVQGTAEFHTAAHGLFGNVLEAGLTPAWDMGLLALWEEGAERPARQLLFFDVEEPDGEPDGVEIMRLPAGRFRNVRMRESDPLAAPQVFSDLFAQGGEHMVIETEPVMAVSDASVGTYELRCSLPA